MSERLDAFLSRAGLGSRSHVKVLIRKGHISIAGAVCRDASTAVEPDSTDVAIDGQPVERATGHIHLLMHKPVGHACSHDDRERPIIDELLPRRAVLLHAEPAGRLDRATSGLLIVSSDGGLIHKLIHPRKKVPKRYRITYTGDLSGGAEKRFLKGIVLEDSPEPTLPALLTREDPDDRGRARCTVILTEGRWHQVRRMIQACGGEVVKLHRDRIGRLDLPADLIAGQSRELTTDELALLHDADPADLPPT